MRLDAYIFELEPHNETWKLTIECACEIDGGWKSITIRVPKKHLLQSFFDEDIKSDLYDYWQKQSADCKKIEGLADY
jgi:hypothetical protein